MNPKDRVQTALDRAPLDYLEPACDEPTARVLKHGADKYGPRNYTKEPVNLRVYVAAMRRHITAFLQGEDIDPDSGQPHLAHVAANCHVVLAAQAADSVVDDRHGTSFDRTNTELADSLEEIRYPSPHWEEHDDIPF